MTGGRIRRAGSWVLDEAPPWFFLLIFGIVCATLAIVSALAPTTVYARFVYPFIVRPLIRTDEGFNPVSTALNLVFIAIGFFWFFALGRTYDLRRNLGYAVVAIVFFWWGAIFRVLEDSGLFAPFDESLQNHAPPIAPGTTCAPELGGLFLDYCARLFFVTPVIWIWAAFATFGLFRVALRTQQVDAILGRRVALNFYAGSLAVLALAYASLWQAQPKFVLFFPSPWIIVGAGLVAYLLVAWRANREGHIDWRWGLVGYGLMIKAWGEAYVWIWFFGGRDNWAPDGGTNPAILLMYLYGPTIIVGSAMAKGILFASRKPGPKRRMSRPARALWLLIFFTILESAIVFVAIANVVLAFEPGPRTVNSARSPGIVALATVSAAGAAGFGTWLASRFAWTVWGTHPVFRIFTDPFNLLMAWSQVADGLMTGLGIDVFGASEKHVLPRALIEWLAQAGLPGPLGAYPAATAMIVYKTILTISAIWILEVHLRRLAGPREELVLQLRMAAVLASFAPGARDALRLAMGV